MTLEKIMTILQGEVICGKEFLNMDIVTACGCDLMSHVLFHISDKSVSTMLLTGLANPQVIYAADAVDIKAICFVRGNKPGEDTVKLAEERNIVLIWSELPMFEACGKLYKNGIMGTSEYASTE